MGPISEEDMVSTIMVYKYRISLDNDVLFLKSIDYIYAFILIELFDGLLL